MVKASLVLFGLMVGSWGLGFAAGRWTAERDRYIQYLTQGSRTEPWIACRKGDDLECIGLRELFEGLQRDQEETEGETVVEPPRQEFKL